MTKSAYARAASARRRCAQRAASARDFGLQPPFNRAALPVRSQRKPAGHSRSGAAHRGDTQWPYGKRPLWLGHLGSAPSEGQRISSGLPEAMRAGRAAADDVNVDWARNIIFAQGSDAGAGGMTAFRYEPGLRGKVVWDAEERNLIFNKPPARSTRTRCDDGPAITQLRPANARPLCGAGRFLMRPAGRVGRPAVGSAKYFVAPPTNQIDIRNSSSSSCCCRLRFFRNISRAFAASPSCIRIACHRRGASVMEKAGLSASPRGQCGTPSLAAPARCHHQASPFCAEAGPSRAPRACGRGPRSRFSGVHHWCVALCAGGRNEPCKAEPAARVKGTTRWRQETHEVRQSVDVRLACRFIDDIFDFDVGPNDALAAVRLGRL